MHIKLIAVDMDGTLLLPGSHHFRRLKNAMLRVKKVNVVLTTGRPYAAQLVT